MKIVCGSCGAKYSIADEKVKGKVFKIRCKKCSNVIVVKGDAHADESPVEEPALDSGMGSAYGGTSAASEWYVVVDGDQVGPISPEEVEAYYASGQVHDESFAWRDGLADWVPLSQLDEFAHLAHLGGMGSDEATVLAQSPYAQEGAGEEEADDYDYGDATSLMPASEFRSQLDEEAPAAQAAVEGDYGGDTAYDSGGSFGGYDSGGSYGGDAGYDSGGSYGGYDSGGSYGGYDSGGSYGGVEASAEGAAQEEQDQAAGDNQGMFASFDSGADGADSGFGGVDGFGQDSQAAGSGAMSENELIGQRNENSVLFSLSSLDQVKAVSAPSGEDQAGAQGAAGAEGSGLIDIQALASAHQAMKGSGQAAGPADLPGLDSQFGAGTMSMPALMPMGSHRDNRPLIIGAVVLVVLLFLALGGVIFFLATKEDPAPVVQEVIQPAQQEGQADQQQPTDPAAEAEEAEAAAAAAKAVEGEEGDSKKDEDEEALAAAEEADEDKKEEDDKKGSRAPAARSSSSSSSKPAAAAKPAAKPKPKAQAKKDDDIFDLLDKKEDKKPAAKPSSGGASSGGGSAAAKNLPDKLSRSMVQSTVNKYNGRIRNCYTDSNSNKLGGQVMVNYSIQPNGRVKSASVSTAKFKGTDVGRCVEGVVKSMKFPETKSPLTVNYPFMLR